MAYDIPGQFYFCSVCERFSNIELLARLSQHLKNLKSNNMSTTKTKKKTSAGSAEKDSRLLDFFHGEIKDIYWAEKHLLKAIPKMSKAAHAPELKEAFNNHLDETKGHVERLEQVFEILGFKPEAKKCEAMDGITKEGDSIVEETKAGTSTRDVGLILAGQKVEHYEISTYGGLAQLARNLGHDDIAEILETTLNEEKTADETLTSIAEENVNYSAAQEVED
jgi:ferritin-like metal-binding protein YciE